jgi:hypothetical protein
MTTDNLKKKILDEIAAGKVYMRPRAYFVVQMTALVVVALAALVVSIFIFNFIAFSIRLNRADMLIGLGPQGWLTFLTFFPWTMLALDVLLVFVLEWLVRRFSWGYKVPMLYLLAGLLALTVFTGIAIDRATPLNDRLWHVHRGLPSPLRDIYLGARHHDIDDSLRAFGIAPGPDTDDATTTPLPPQAQQ